MPMHALATPSLLSCGTGGAVCSASSDKKTRVERVVSAVGLLPLQLKQRRWRAPFQLYDATSSTCVQAKIQCADVVSAQGKMRTVPLRRVVRCANSEQVADVSEDKTVKTSDESDNGPPVLTIIAGLFVLFVVLWAVSSLLSWIVGLIFR